MSGSHEIDVGSSRAQRRVLLQVLALNAGLALVLFVGGLMADSSGLLANALDNISDALTYAVSITAVSRSILWKARAANVTGVMLLVLAVGVTLDAFRRYKTGSQPLGATMVVLAIVATAVNAWSLQLLRRFQKQDVNLRAAWTMSTNDFVSNIGILVAGGLVAYTGSNLPDLAIGLFVAAIAIYGSIKTFRDTASARLS
jgi:Co/Zn/Cd efflux system component